MTFVSGLCIGGILQRCQHKYCYRQWATGAPATQVSYHIASAQSPIKCQPLFMNIQSTLDNSKFKKNHFSSSYARFWLRYGLSYRGTSWLNLNCRDKRYRGKTNENSSYRLTDRIFWRTDLYRQKSLELSRVNCMCLGFPTPNPLVKNNLEKRLKEVHQLVHPPSSPVEIAVFNLFG